MAKTFEVLRIKKTGVAYDLVGTKWGGSITAGVPEDIVDSRSSAMSGTATLLPPKNSRELPHPGMFKGLVDGAAVSLEAWSDTRKLISVDFILTRVKYTEDSIEVSFSTDALSFSNLVRLAPVMAAMPEGWGNALTKADDTWARNLSKVFALTSPVYPVFAAFREAGYSAVPPTDYGRTMMDFPLQWVVVSDAWSPNGGHTISASLSSDVKKLPVLVVENGMTWLSNGVIWGGVTREGYRSWGDISELSGHFMVGENSTGYVEALIIFGGENWLNIRCSNRGDVKVHSPVGSPADLPAGSFTAPALVKFSVSKNHRKWRVDVGSKSIEGTFTPDPKRNVDNADTFTGARIISEAGGRLAGFQIRNLYSATSHYADKWGHMYPQTAFIDAPLTHGTGVGTRSVKDVEARDVLDAAAKALCASWWIDEDGNAQFKDMRALHTSPIKKVLSFDRDADSYELNSSDVERRDNVNIEYSEVSYSKNQLPRITLFEANANTLSPGDVKEEFIEPADDAEWFGVDWTLSWFNKHLMTRAQMLQNSWVSTTVEKGTGKTSNKMQRITPWLYKFTGEASGDTDYSATYEVDGQKFPLIRGIGLAKFKKNTAKFGVSSASSPFTLDAQGWVTDRAGANALGQYLVSLPRSDAPLTKLGIIYSPTLRLGDRFKLVAGENSTVNRDLIILAATHNPSENRTDLEVYEISAADTAALDWAAAQENARKAGATFETVHSRTRRDGDIWSKVQGNSDYPYGV